ncbi:MAG: MFS transporter, partial [Nocardioidaceae bacterium]
PDPLVLAKSVPAPATTRAVTRRGIGSALPIVRRNPAALTGIVTVACAHAFMVGVMAMTPVHMQDHGTSLRIVGLTISLHIAGMFALSPVMGVLADRWGRVRTAVLGQAILFTAAVVAGTAGGSDTRITVGLVLLGLGWSASLIAGSAMVADAVSVADRPGVQGFSDLAMNLSGAAGGVVAGLVVSGAGFGWLNALAVLLVVPVLWRVARATRPVATASS